MKTHLKKPIRDSCLECGAPLERGKGRSDRKFCCNECRCRWHNRQRENARRMIIRVNTILLRNHDILESLISRGTESIGHYEAVAMGFNPEFVTSCRHVTDGTEYMCYDIRYLVSSGALTEIRKYVSHP